MKYCTYGCDGQGVPAAFFYEKSGGGVMFLCSYCHGDSADILRSVCKPLSAVALSNLFNETVSAVYDRMAEINGAMGDWADSSPNALTLDDVIMRIKNLHRLAVSLDKIEADCS